MKKSVRGFTLTELIVVMAVSAVLMTALIILASVISRTTAEAGSAGKLYSELTDAESFIKDNFYSFANAGSYITVSENKIVIKNTEQDGNDAVQEILFTQSCLRTITDGVSGCTMECKRITGMSVNYNGELGMLCVGLIYNDDDGEGVKVYKVLCTLG